MDGSAPLGRISGRAAVRAARGAPAEDGVRRNQLISKRARKPISGACPPEIASLSYSFEILSRSLR